MKRIFYMAIVLLFIGLCAVPAFAANESGVITSSYYGWEVSSDALCNPGSAAGTRFIKFSNIENYAHITLFATQIDDEDIGLGSWPFTARYDAVGGAVIGSGTLSIFDNGNPTNEFTVHVQFDSWDIGSYTGSHKVYLVGPPDTGALTYSNCGGSPVGLSAGSTNYPAKQIYPTVYFTTTWSNLYEFTDGTSWGRVNITRGQPSTVTICQDTDEEIVADEYKTSGSTVAFLTKNPITVTVAFGGFGGSHIKYFYITGTPPPDAPAANFTASPLSGVPPLDVYFTDTSTGTPTSWFWKFGDGWTSYQQNPIHTYSGPGNYTVTLEATNAAGSDTETKTGYIVAGITGSYNLKINPIGKNLTHLSGVNISVYTDSGHTNLYNSQITDAVTYRYDSDLPANQQYYITLVKDGYINATSSVFLNANRNYDVMMYLPGETVPETTNYTSMSVFVFDYYTGATVPALVSYYTDSGHTALFGSAYVNSYSGAANLFLEQESNYFARITANGYYPYDFTVSTGTSASIERTYRLQPIAAPVTPTPGTTGTPGATPTYMTVVTLSPAERAYQVDIGLDVWYRNLGFLSNLFFLAIITGTLGLIMNGFRRRGRQ